MFDSHIENREEGAGAKGVLLTVGHSNHTLPAFLAVLRQHGASGLIDVRTVPASSRFPQFSKRNLADSCVQHGIQYIWLPELGGGLS